MVYIVLSWQCLDPIYQVNDSWHILLQNNTLASVITKPIYKFHICSVKKNKKTQKNHAE